jgi:hypothetical protein
MSSHEKDAAETAQPPEELDISLPVDDVFGLEILGTSVPVFIGITLILAGGCAFMTGAALARSWIPLNRILPYAMLLGLASRFLIFALFQGELLSVSGYLIDCACLLALAFLGYRLTQAHLMCAQYPWLYERAGLFTWRDRKISIQ